MQKLTNIIEITKILCYIYNSNYVIDMQLEVDELKQVDWFVPLVYLKSNQIYSTL